jgi:multiple sugar transport system substrate-binding protein
MAEDETTSTSGEEVPVTRRELLRRTGVGVAAIGLAGSGASKAFAFFGPHKYTHRQLSGRMSILQWTHFVPAYDAWFDPYAKAWGEKNDVQVTVDHIDLSQIPARAAAEVAAGSGHDLIQHLSPPAAFEDQVINHANVIKDITKKVGKMNELAHKSTYNPRTKKYFGVSDMYVPDPVIWRRDLWNGVGEAPLTWDHVRKAAPKLKAAGHPIGIGMSNELDSNMALIAFLMCFGAHIQNESNHVTLNTKHAVDAVKFMVDLYKGGETDEIFGWVPASNNNFLYSGRGSMILNAISATRTPEDRHLPFADDLNIWPIPRGPAGRRGLEHVMGVYTIWKFANNKAAAQKFLHDLITTYQTAFTNSKFYNFPSFPNTVKNIQHQLAQDKHKPLGKYTVLGTIARKYTYNVGWPGYSNAAIDEMFNTFLIPQMFAQVAQGKMSAADSVRSTAGALNTIFAKWRKRGKI